MNRNEVCERIQELYEMYLENEPLSEHFGYAEAVEIATNAVNKVEEHKETFEWCHDCKEYDQECHCCHRWSKQIKKTNDDLLANYGWHDLNKDPDDLPVISTFYLCCSKLINDNREYKVLYYHDKKFYNEINMEKEYKGVTGWTEIHMFMRRE